MQLLFIRHAQSTNNQLYDETGNSIGRSEDPSLTEVGFEQAQRLAEHLARGIPGFTNRRIFGHRPGYGLTHLYSSLMLRAVQTGSIISKRLGITLEGWIDLHESGGVYIEDPINGECRGRPGCRRSELIEKFPGLCLPAGVTESGWWNMDFEPHEDQLARAARLIDELLRKHKNTDDHIALISHGTFYNAFLFILCGMAKDNKTWFALNNAAITRIDFGPDCQDVVYLNRVEFLPPDLIT